LHQIIPAAAGSGNIQDWTISPPVFSFCPLDAKRLQTQWQFARRQQWTASLPNNQGHLMRPLFNFEIRSAKLLILNFAMLQDPLKLRLKKTGQKACPMYNATR
jgi:hypothetical protein